MRTVIIGPPGAGKGTQAVSIAKNFNMTHLSSGDILRAEINSGSELGKKMSEVMARGELVSDDLVVKIMFNAINAVDGRLILDGFPRTLAQADALRESLKQNQMNMDSVLLINVDDESIVKRITGRRMCPECGKGFHVEYVPSSRGEFCDVCENDVKLTQRDDDNEATVRQRLKSYYEQTEPVVEYYRQSDNVSVIEIDGMQSPEEVEASINAELKIIAK